MDVREYVYGTFDGGVPLHTDVYYKPVANDSVREARPIGKQTWRIHEQSKS